MTLGLSLQQIDTPGCNIPTAARVEAVLWSVAQCRCRGHAGDVLTSTPVKNLFIRLAAYDRPSWTGLRAGVDAALLALPSHEIGFAPAATPDVRPALPAMVTFSFGDL